jgi:hypothetical protein
MTVRDDPRRHRDIADAATNAEFDADFQAADYVTAGKQMAAEFGAGGDPIAVALFALVHALAFQHEFDIKTRNLYETT